MTYPDQIRPLQTLEYLLFFGVPAILMTLSVYWLLPGLLSIGISEYLGLQIVSLVPYLALFFGASIAFQVEGNPWSWEVFKDRFRLQKLNRLDWFWGLALIIFALTSYLTLRSVITTLTTYDLLVLPAAVPRIITPNLDVSLEDLAGGGMKGNWSLLIFSLVVLFFNIIGEELWWRGYLLPRQELTQGKATWIIHGILWTFFHVFKYWELIAILPVSLALSYVVQRRKKTWLGIIAHLVVNSLGIIGIFFLVIG